MAKKKLKIQDPLVIDEMPIYDGMIVMENDFFRIEIRDLELDYSGTYYEGDEPSVSGKLVTFKK